MRDNSLHKVIGRKLSDSPTWVWPSEEAQIEVTDSMMLQIGKMTQVTDYGLQLTIDSAGKVPPEMAECIAIELKALKIEVMRLREEHKNAGDNAEDAIDRLTCEKIRYTEALKRAEAAEKRDEANNSFINERELAWQEMEEERDALQNAYNILYATLDRRAAEKALAAKEGR